MPYEMEFNSFVISCATLSIPVLFNAWLGLSYWDMVELGLQHGILLAFEYLGTRSQILFNKIKSKMTGSAKPKKFGRGQHQGPIMFRVYFLELHREKQWGLLLTNDLYDISPSKT